MYFNTGRKPFCSISSLYLEGLKETVREWLKSAKPMNSLLWECYEEQLEGCSPKPTCDNCIQFSISEVLPERAKRLLAAAEAFGSSELSVMFGRIPENGSNRVEPCFDVACLHSSDVRRYFESLVCTVEKQDLLNRYQGFAGIVDLAKFIQENVPETSLVKVIVRKNSEYELLIRVYKNQERWRDLDHLFCFPGMSACRSADAPIATWRVNAYTSEEFCQVISKLTKKTSAKRTS